MRVTFMDRIAGHPFMQAAVGILFLFVLYSYLTEDMSLFWVIVVGLAVMRGIAAAKRVKEHRDWEAVKRPATARKQAEVPQIASPPKRRFWHDVRMAFGHPLFAWPLHGACALLLLAWIASDHREPADNVLAGLIAISMLLTILARRYRSRAKRAESTSVQQLPPGVLAADDANPVRSVVPALAPTPSVKEAIQALPPALYQLIFAGLKAEAARPAH